jgi:hypothetical protein
VPFYNISLKNQSTNVKAIVGMDEVEANRNVDMVKFRVNMAKKLLKDYFQ